MNLRMTQFEEELEFIRRTFSLDLNVGLMERYSGWERFQGKSKRSAVGCELAS